MKKLEQDQQLNDLKKQILNIIDRYNNESDGEKLRLAVVNECTREEKVDVTRYLICSYKTGESTEHQIGLFTKSDYNFSCSKKDLYTHHYYFNNEIYTGVYENLISVRTHEEGYFTNDRYRLGDYTDHYFLAVGSAARINYTDVAQVNCRVHKIYSFEQIRSKMYSEGKIGSYEIGKATNEEIIKVLAYANEVLCVKPVEAKAAKQKKANVFMKLFQ